MSFSDFYLQFQLEFLVRKVKRKKEKKIKNEEKKLTPTVKKGMGLLGVGGESLRKYLGVQGEGSRGEGGKRRAVGAEREGSHSSHQSLLAVSC